MKIAIIGAGRSGLATAAVLTRFGHEVIVFEKAPDVGGVWSSTRAYPGVTTQDDRVSYAFSDLPMPPDFPEHPPAPRCANTSRAMRGRKDSCR